MKSDVFNQVQSVRPRTNRFDLSHDVKLSFNMGQLVPTLLMECVPGDRVRLSSENLFRFAPMLAPIMHRVKAYTHFFFVPNRLLWANWEKFITRSSDGKVIPDDDLPVWPYLDVSNSSSFFGIGTLMDYLGLPVTGSSMPSISALPFSAYQCVYDSYYRDENLVDPVSYLLSDGLNNPSAQSLMVLRRRSWMHDYFTSALPFAQKGQPVSISPVQEFPDVEIYRNSSDGIDPFSWDNNASTAGAFVATDDRGLDPSRLYADTSGLELDSITINDLRRASKLQEWLEKNARGGSRYTETIQSHFGVKSPDSRLNRPEFIGGVSQNVQISEVLQTSQTDESVTPQANMAGHAVSIGSGKVKSYFCQEHGFIIGITSIMPVTSYQQGIHRMWSRSSALDYYWPSFAHLGEQEVLSKELYADGTSADDDIFGYVPRYSEYKFLNSRVAGDFRDTLDFWHLGRKFAGRPVLNSDFIECNPDDRIFAVIGDVGENVQHIYAHVYNNVQAVRLMPVFGTPKL